MRRRPVAKRVDIVLQPGAVRVDGRVVSAHALAQEVGIVDTLAAGEDLLAAHEEVVGVGCFGVVGGREGVEGADGGGEGVEDVEVCFVAVVDEFAEVFLVGGAVLVVRRKLAGGCDIFGDFREANRSIEESGFTC